MISSRRPTKASEKQDSNKETFQLSVSTQQIDQTNFVLAEKQDREKRKSNLIVFGVKVERETEDRTQIEKLFSSIGVDSNTIEHVRRFRSKYSQGTETEPIFVRLKEGVDRM